MAGLSYSLAFGHKGIKSDKNYEILLNSIRSNELDFSHKNKLWQCLFWTSEEREKNFPGIGEVLYVAGDYLPDRGLYDQENQVPQDWSAFPVQDGESTQLDELY